MYNIIPKLKGFAFIGLSFFFYIVGDNLEKSYFASIEEWKFDDVAFTIILICMIIVGIVAILAYFFFFIVSFVDKNVQPTDCFDFLSKIFWIIPMAFCLTVVPYLSTVHIIALACVASMVLALQVFYIDLEHLYADVNRHG